MVRHLTRRPALGKERGPTTRKASDSAAGRRRRTRATRRRSSQRELRGEEVRRGAVAGGVLEAEGEEGEEDGVLVRGGEAALVDELEDALGEGKGGVGVGVEEQRGILGGGGEEVSSARRCEVCRARRLARRWRRRR